MRRILFLGLILVLVVVILVGLSQCRGRTPASETANPQTAPADSQTVETPVETPALTTQEPTSTMPAIISFVTPDTIAVGETVPVSVELYGVPDLGEVMVVVAAPIFNVAVMDEDLGAEGVQITPGLLPEGAQVVENSFDATGRLTYQVSGLGISAGISRTLFTMHLVGVSPGVGELVIEQVVARTTDGVEIQIMPNPGMINVVEGVATPEPTQQPVAQPVAPVTAGSLQPGIYYHLQAGQNLFRVALEFGSTVEAIAQANGIADVNAVPAGKLLYIPVAPPVGRAAYFVNAHDTLYSLAHTFGLTVESLAAQNNFQPPYDIRVGQWLILLP